MQPDPVPPPLVDAPAPAPGQTRKVALSPRRVESPNARTGRLRLIAVAICGVVVVSLAPLLWAEIDPVALREAEAAYRRNDLMTALRKALGHLDRRPSSRGAAIISARCFSRLGQVDRAEPYYRQAGPLGLDDLHVRAFGLVRVDHRERAIQAYREILARAPDDVLALRRMAAVQISQGRWDEALDTANRLIRIPAGAAIGHTLAGVVHHDENCPERAAAEFELVLRVDPELREMPLSPRSMFWSYFIQDLLAVGRPADARRHLAHALEEGPEAYLMDLLGKAHWMQGEFEDAERCWRQSIQWDGRRSWPWLLLGKLELQRNRPGEAIAPLGRAVELAPTAFEPTYSLSLAHRRVGRLEEAERLREKAQRIREKSGQPPGGMGTFPSPKT